MVYITRIEGDYDYVIVGGGSAGCVLANRLSENPDNRVLLIEAGGNAKSPLVELPFGFAYLLDNPQFDWRLEQGPEPGAAGRVLPYPRGKAIGGSSSINGMLYVRGLARDYDRWRDEGLAGWGWDDVEPWFRKLEDYRGTSEVARGRGGPTTVVPAPNWHPLSDVVVAAAAQSGVGGSDDYNGPEPTGLGRGQLFFRNGRRCGSARAYIRPVEHRRNLEIATDTLALSILFDGGTGGRRAVGVRYRRKDGVGDVRAGREVLLSAGVIGSPHLLELSGVGQGERLRALGIPVVHDSPAVGEHLQDHYLTFVVQNLHGIKGLGREINGWRGWLAGAQSILLRRGWLNGIPSQITGHATVAVDGVEQPIQIIGAPLRFTRDPVKKTVIRHATPGLMLGAYLGQPRSRGFVHARSAQAGDAPDIVANFLGDDHDLRGTMAAVRLIRDIIAQPALAPYLREELAPGAAAQDDAALEAYIRKAGASAYHPVGTCRMANDPAHGVVGADLKVHGIDGLRVVDASVMPSLVTANTHAAAVMIGERAAALIASF